MTPVRCPNCGQGALKVTSACIHYHIGLVDDGEVDWREQECGSAFPSNDDVHPYEIECMKCEAIWLGESDDGQQVRFKQPLVLLSEAV